MNKAKVGGCTHGRERTRGRDEGIFGNRARAARERPARSKAETQSKISLPRSVNQETDPSNIEREQHRVMRSWGRHVQLACSTPLRGPIPTRQLVTSFAIFLAIEGQGRIGKGTENCPSAMKVGHLHGAEVNLQLLDSCGLSGLLEVHSMKGGVARQEITLGNNNTTSEAWKASPGYGWPVDKHGAWEKVMFMRYAPKQSFWGRAPLCSLFRLRSRRCRDKS